MADHKDEGKKCLIVYRFDEMGTYLAVSLESKHQKVFRTNRDKGVYFLGALTRNPDLFLHPFVVSLRVSAKPACRWNNEACLCSCES